MVICRGHVIVSKGTFQTFLAIDGYMVKLMSKSDFSLLSSFVLNWLGGWLAPTHACTQIHAKHGHWGIITMNKNAF